MKKLIIINGAPGSGKTSVASILYQSLNASVWLDGDWCWMMNPFLVNDKNKEMVESNIFHVLNNFLANSQFHYIIFNWVIGHEKLMKRITDNLNLKGVKTYKISLVCSDLDVLEKRLKKDGRSQIEIADSIKRQESYYQMNTIKIDSSSLSLNDVSQKIVDIVS